MPSIDERFQVGTLLDVLRRDIGDSEFGYRSQGLLAHVLLRIGGKILDIKSQGHPDITADLGSKTLLLQVKSVRAKAIRQSFIIGTEDLDGIRPVSANAVGYLAILECVPPISWILIDYSRLVRLQSKPTSVITLRAMARRDLSSECTEEFVRLVVQNKTRLRDLGFPILCSRALRGEPF